MKRTPIFKIKTENEKLNDRLKYLKKKQQIQSLNKEAFLIPDNDGFYKKPLEAPEFLIRDLEAETTGVTFDEISKIKKSFRDELLKLAPLTIVDSILSNDFYTDIIISQLMVLWPKFKKDLLKNFSVIDINTFNEYVKEYLSSEKIEVKSIDKSLVDLKDKINNKIKNLQIQINKAKLMKIPKEKINELKKKINNTKYIQKESEKPIDQKRIEKLSQKLEEFPEEENKPDITNIIKPAEKTINDQKKQERKKQQGDNKQKSEEVISEMKETTQQQMQKIIVPEVKKKNKEKMLNEITKLIIDNINNNPNYDKKTKEMILFENKQFEITKEYKDFINDYLNLEKIDLAKKYKRVKDDTRTTNMSYTDIGIPSYDNLFSNFRNNQITKRNNLKNEIKKLKDNNENGENNEFISQGVDILYENFPVKFYGENIKKNKKKDNKFKRYELLKAQILSGNDNKRLLKEIKKYK